MTASTPNPNPYLRTKVQTASPGELRLMLLNGAVRFLEQGIQGLEEKNPEMTYGGISRCQHIVMELLGSLRPEEAPELCERMSSLYTYMYLQLVTACTDGDLSVARSVLDLLRYERETWSMLLESMATEGGSTSPAKGTANGAAAAPEPAPPGRAENGNAAPRPIGGNVSVKV